MLILKENAANSVPTPPVGKDTFFIDDSGVPSVKNAAGNVSTFPTVVASNSQVVFMNGTSLSGEAALTYDFNNNVLNIIGNVAAGNVKTDNLLYSNGAPWDFQLPGGSNTQIQFNDNGDFGGSAAFVFNKTSNLITASANVNANNFNATTHITAGNVYANSGTVGAATLTASTNANVGNLNATGNAIISGNLTVNGNIVYVNVETLDVEDPIISLGGGPNGAAPVSDDGKDRGTALQYFSGSAKTAFMGWDNSNAEFGMASQASITNEVVTWSSYGNLRVGNIIGNGQALTGLTGANVTGTVANATHASTANTVVDNAQPNITSVGTLTSLTSSGNVTANNINATTYVTAASIFANTGSVGANFISAAQDVTASRDVLAGNLFANSGIVRGNTGNFSGNVSAGGIKTDNLYYANGSPWDLQLPGGSNTQIQFNDADQFGGSAAFTFDKSSNLVTVSANLNANNLNATTHVTAGNVWANSGTVGASLLTGTLTTQSQPNITSVGSLTGLTLAANGDITLSGAGSEISGANLVSASFLTGTLTTATQPNITSVGSLTGLTMAANADITLSGTGSEILGANLVSASFLTGTLTTATQPNITSVGSLSSLTVTGNASANNFNATTHVTAGNVWANSGTVGASLLTGTLTTAAQPNITSVGSLSSLTVVGNAGANNFNATTHVTAGNVYANSGTVAASLLTGTLTTAAQPNITSVGTLSSLTVTGTATAGNVSTGGVVSATGNVSGGNINTAGVVAATGNVSGGNLTTGGVVAATGNVSGGNINTAGKVVASTLESNVATGTAPLVVASTTKVANLNADLLDGFSTDTAATANTVVVRDANGSFSANVVTANLSGNATTAGTVVTAAQPNITSVGTLTGLGVNGTITGVNITANTGIFTGNAAGLTNIPGANIVGNISGNISNANYAAFAGEVVDASQPNITSLGTLTSLSVTGTATAGNLSTGGNLSVSGNAVISGNLTVDGNLVYVNVDTLAVEDPIIQLQTGPNGAAPAANSGKDVGSALNYYDTQARIAFMGWDVSNAEFGMASQASITSEVVTFSAYGNLRVGNIIGNGQALTGLTGANVTGQVANALVAGTVYTAAQPNITSVGTLSSLAVTGNATAGNVYANSGTIGASLLTGTLTTAAQPNVTSLGTLTGLGVNGNITAANITANTGVFTGNGSGLSALAGANVTGQVANAIVAGTVYTAAQPNITSVGTLTSLAITGNATAGNVYANSGTIGASLLTGTLTTAAQPNITSVGTLSSLSVTANVAAGNLTTTGVLSVTGTGVSTIAGNLDMTGNTIINLATPTNATDAATKQYVDDVAQGLNIHDSCAAATPDTLANITSGTITYNNGSNGVGAFLATTGTFNLIDGVNVQTAGTRILVKNEANAVFNGIYTYTNTTAITRAVDFDSIPEVEAGDFTFITGGTLYDNTGWVQTESPTGIGTAGNNISFTQFSGAGTYQAGTGLTLLGSTFSVNASQTQVTSVGTLTGLNVNGNITAANITANTGVFTGNGSGLSAIAGGNVTGQVANAAVAGTVYTAAQPNITSVGTLTSLSVTGNVSAGNVSGTLLTGTLATASQPNVTSLGTLTGLGVNGTITGVNITANTGVFTGNGSGLSALAGANVTGQVANAAVAGTVYTAAQPNITSVGTLTSLTVTGNASAGNISTGGVLSVTGNANVGNIGAAAGVFTSVSGNGAALTDLNASNISTGTLAQARLANSTLTLGNTTLTLGATTTTVAGLTNITSTQLTSNVATGTAPLVVTSTTRVANLNVATAGVANTVNDAAQPNITSVGTLTSLAVTGNASAGNLNTAGAVVASTLTSNVATGTAPLTVTSTTRVANLNVAYANVADFVNISDVSTGTYYPMLANAATGNVSEGSNSALTFNAATGALSATLLTGTLTTAAQPNITSVGTLTSLGVSGNITAPNLIANTGFVISSVNAAVSAAGTAQGNATALTRQINVTSTVASGAGVALPAAVAGMRVTIINTAANAVLVYPASGGTINSLALNAAFSQAAGARLDFIATTGTQWYTLNATYL